MQPSLRAQGLGRINSRGAARWQGAGDQRRDQEQQPAHEIGEEIVAGDAEELGFQRTTSDPRDSQTDHHARKRDGETTSHDVAQHVPLLGAEGHANSDLARPLPDQTRQHAVDADAREQQRRGSGAIVICSAVSGVFNFAPLVR